MTSIEPVAAWITALGGSAVQVVTLIPPSANPHLFELSPSQLRQADRAVGAVFIGAGFEPWSKRLVENARLPEDRVVYLADRLTLLSDADHGHGHGVDAQNPHFWLDPVIAVQCVDRIATLLRALLPDSAAQISHRAEAYRDSLHALDSTIRSTIDSWNARAFIADHGTWTYFAHRYGLREVALLERVPGRDASASELRHILDLVRSRSASAVFADERSNNRAARQLSDETGLPLVPLRPTSASGGYLATMRYNLRMMDEVMR